MKQRNFNGQLLLEVLLALSAAAIVVVVGGQIIFASLQANKRAGEKDVAGGLIGETFSAVKAIAVEDWSGNIYSKTKGSTNYYVEEQLSGRWGIAVGQESVSKNNINYTRSFVIQNVCRAVAGDGSREITGVTDSSGFSTTCTGNGGTHDPSTQKITVTVSWTNADPVSGSEYITRWMNKVCVQTDWNTSGGTSGSCPSTSYDSSTNITSGTGLQICSGGC